jgi:hypothetical protein
LPHPAQSASVSGVQLEGQHPSANVPLQTVALHPPPSAVVSTLVSTEASRRESLDPASGTPPSPSGPTSPYVERCVVCAVAVEFATFTVVESRLHVDPLATASRTEPGAIGATSAF